MAGSTIPLFKLAIVQALNAAVWPAFSTGYSEAPRPQIFYGEPDEKDRDSVIVGDTADGEADQEWLAFDSAKHELFVIRLSVATWVPGLTCQEAVERAFAMFAVAEQIVRTGGRTTPAFGVTGAIGAQLRQPTHDELNTPEGWTCVITSGVRCEARITP